jgi:hypothetical protein
MRLEPSFAYRFESGFARPVGTLIATISSALARRAERVFRSVWLKAFLCASVPLWPRNL